MTNNKFLQLLFNPGETVCVSDNKFGYHSVRQEDLDGSIILQSPRGDVGDRLVNWSDITLISINPIKGFRRDENVSALRAFLIELDEGLLQDQKKYIEDIGVPYSACVFSGNKSLHFIIVLDQDLPNKEIWSFYCQWILNILKRADQQTKNPSRSIRVPDNMRPGCKKQSLVECRDRISHDILLQWLNQFPDQMPKIHEKRKTVSNVEGSFEKLSKWAQKELSEGIQFNNGRNSKWYALGCEFAINGFDLPTTINILCNYFTEENDFSYNEWETTIKSAFKRFDL